MSFVDLIKILNHWLCWEISIIYGVNLQKSHIFYSEDKAD